MRLARIRKMAWRPPAPRARALGLVPSTLLSARRRPSSSSLAVKHAFKTSRWKGVGTEREEMGAQCEGGKRVGLG
jgi:hypothetical protein